MERTEAQKNKKLLTAVLVYAILILVLIVIANLAPFNRFLGTVLRLLRPVIIGLSLAYLLNPFFNLFERKLFYKIKPISLRRGISLVFTYLVLIAVFAVLILLIVPQLTDSILNFADNSEVYLQKTLDSVNDIIARINTLLPLNNEGQQALPSLQLEAVKEGVANLFSSLKLDSDMLMDLLTAENLGTIIDTFKNIVSLFGDILFGLFISLYFLASKEKRYAQVMRWRKAFLSNGVNAYITKVCTTADRSFGGFLKGKILDSCIIGVLVFISISVLKIPYAILIAVIVAITDIIPIIGPFIGVIPSAVIILLTDPSKVIPFLLCILIIQQIDGNIIAPKILGENTGVSSLCVMISITTLGSLWGLAGMILGVPLFATVLELTSDFLDRRLRQKGLATATEAYYSTDAAGTDHSPTDDESVPTPTKRKKGKSPEPPVTDGQGILTAREEDLLNTYTLAAEYKLFGSHNDESFAEFAEACQERRNRPSAEEDPTAVADAAPAEESRPTADTEEASVPTDGESASVNDAKADVPNAPDPVEATAPTDNSRDAL